MVTGLLRKALEAIVIADASDSVLAEFDVLADTLIKTYQGISNLQVAPFGTIRRIYPLVDPTQDNRGALNHALLLDPGRKGGAVAAIRSRETTVAGPLRLLQGGVAAIARRPIFSRRAPQYLPDEWFEVDGVNHSRICSVPELRIEDECSYPGPLDGTGQQTYFWGFVTMLTRMEDVLATTHLSTLESGEQGGVAGITQFAYELSDSDPHPSLADVGGIWQRSSNTDALSDSVIVDVAVEEFGFRWILKVAPMEGWPVVSEDFWRLLKDVPKFRT